MADKDLKLTARMLPTTYSRTQDQSIAQLVSFLRLASKWARRLISIWPSQEEQHLGLILPCDWCQARHLKSLSEIIHHWCKIRGSTPCCQLETSTSWQMLLRLNERSGLEVPQGTNLAVGTSKTGTSSADSTSRYLVCWYMSGFRTLNPT